MLSLHPRPIKSETLWFGPNIKKSFKSLGDSNVQARESVE